MKTVKTYREILEEQEMVGEKGKYYTWTIEPMYNNNMPEDIDTYLKKGLITGYKRLSKTSKMFMLYGERKNLMKVMKKYGWNSEKELNPSGIQIKKVSK